MTILFPDNDWIF